MIEMNNPPAGVTATGAEVNILDGALITTAQLNSARYTKWPMACFGTWTISGDGARTNGGGIVGDVALLANAPAFSKVYDEGTAAFANLASSDGLAGWAAPYQLLSDAGVEQVNDAFYIGHATPFCECANTPGSGTAATWGATGGLYEYYNGASWVTLMTVIAIDNTDTTASDGNEPLQRDGAISFIPPDDWATITVDSQLAYWIRWRVTALQLTQSPVTNSTDWEIITPADGFLCPHDGIVTDIRLIDAATTLHFTAVVVFILMNFTTGAHSGAAGVGHTFAVSQRQDAYSGLTLVVNRGDELGVLCTEEDTNNDDPINVLLELGVTRS